MKKLVFALAAVVSLPICYSNVVAQGFPDMPQSNVTEKTEEQKHDERVARVLTRHGSIRVKREARVVKEGPLAPSAQDIADNELLLSKSNTGLMRLLPREVVDKPDSPVAKELNIRGNGAYYSFFYVAHEYGYGSDIELNRDQLLSGFAGCDFGFFTELGAVPLDNLSLDDGRVTYLAQYTPPDNEPDARKEQLRSQAGFVLSGQEYRGSLPLKVGSTYLLRSINYSYSDTLTAFTVTRRDEDGSAIIVWKRFKLFKTPQLN